MSFNDDGANLSEFSSKLLLGRSSVLRTLKKSCDVKMDFYINEAILNSFSPYLVTEVPVSILAAN